MQKSYLIWLFSLLALSMETKVCEATDRLSRREQQFKSVVTAAKTLKKLSGYDVLTPQQKVIFEEGCVLISNTYATENMTVIQFINADQELHLLANNFDALVAEMNSLKLLSESFHKERHLTLEDTFLCEGACSCVLDIYTLNNPYLNTFIRSNELWKLLLKPLAQASGREIADPQPTTINQLTPAQRFAQKLIADEKQQRQQQSMPRQAKRRY